MRIRDMGHRLLAASMCMVCMIVLTAGTLPISAQVQRSFDGDRVNLELSGGTYRITAASDGRIRVLPRTKTDRVSVRLNVGAFGRSADLRIIGPADGFDADIELPRRVHISITLTDGTLLVRGIEGNKNISGRSAKVEIQFDDQTEYGQIKASVRKGEVKTFGFADNRIELQSFNWIGPGTHEITVRLEAGQIILRD